MATIYKILSPLLDECYVGSTTMKIEKRWTLHRSDICRSKILFDKYGFDNCKFVVMEVCPLEEQLEKEQWWMDHSAGLVNNNDAIRNIEKKKAYDKEWREANNDTVKGYRKGYYEANKEKVLEASKRYYEAKKLQKKEYYEANKEQIKEQRRMRRKAKKDSPSAE